MSPETPRTDATEPNSQLKAPLLSVLGFQSTMERPGRHLALLLQPPLGRPLVADLVHELERRRPGGRNRSRPSVRPGMASGLISRRLATRSTNQTLASWTISSATARALSSVGSNGFGTAFRGSALDLLHLHAERFHQLGDVGPLEDDADRAGDGVAVDEDAVGGDRGDISGGCGKRATDGDHGLLLGHPADRVVQGLAARGGAARAVDVEDHRLDPVGLRHLVEQLLAASGRR